MEFSEKTIEQIFHLWYSGKKVKDLCKEFDIEYQHALSFAKHFPLIKSSSLCPYCKSDLFAFRSDPKCYKRTKKLYNNLTAHCLNCGHEEKLICNCKGCKLKKIENEKIQSEKEGEKFKKRAIHLERLYNSIVPINFEKDNLIELIYLYILCYQSTCEDVTIISPPYMAESPLTPYGEWDYNIIQTLLNYIAPISDDENLLKFPDDSSASWSGQKVCYRIKIKDVNEIDFLESFLTHIKNRIQNLSFEEKLALISLFEKLMIAECLIYLEFMRNDLGLPHESGPKTIALFKTLIQNWRIDQIYNIIWGRCKEALAYKVQNGLSKKHASNLIVSMISKFVDRANQNNWEIRSYYRAYKNIKGKQSVISYVLFNKILELGGLGVEYNFQDILIKIGQHDSLTQNEKEALDIFN